MPVKRGGDGGRRAQKRTPVRLGKVTRKVRKVATFMINGSGTCDLVSDTSKNKLKCLILIIISTDQGWQVGLLDVCSKFLSVPGPVRLRFLTGQLSSKIGVWCRSLRRDNLLRSMVYGSSTLFDSWTGSWRYIPVVVHVWTKCAPYALFCWMQQMVVYTSCDVLLSRSMI
jgi:hypothetical protein